MLGTGEMNKEKVATSSKKQETLKLGSGGSDMLNSPKFSASKSLLLLYLRSVFSLDESA
jgi:hypothetical protein